MSTPYITTAAPSRKMKVISWILRILAAAAFIAAGSAKLAGVPMLVAIFDQIGIGQWFRIVTGLIEVIGGIALLVPATAGLGGLLLSATMAVAVLTHLFLIGGSAVPAFVLLAITATIVWLHRDEVAARLGRPTSA
ncbi:DoxX family protein [Pseudomonas aeruginosa]|uniref:DoxX family protein n=1 Tax=Pseudomonas aeruginosa TaxID=287 RepID=UPI00093B0052|nr:DoxX family protein [Pseudomonas aeruginosa]HBO1345082.1 DoxX family protein [Pseudomonas aeruginosa]